MNLKRYLLLRMVLVALLCWLGVSAYLIGRSGQQMGDAMARDADQMQVLLETALHRQHTTPEPGPRVPPLHQLAGRFAEPFCLRYQALNGTTTEDGCDRTGTDDPLPRWLANLLTWDGHRPNALQRDIGLWGLPVGTLSIEPDRPHLLARQWHTLRDLLWLATAIVLALGTLTFLVIDRALRPAQQLVAALDHLAAGEQLDEITAKAELPDFQPREFGQIAAGINRLSTRLNQLSAARRELMACLINLQEQERRDLAHGLHDEFGQCVAALSANSALLKSLAVQGEAVAENDFEPLEQTIEHMLAALRSLLLRMAPPLLESRGLTSALNDLITGWQAGQLGAPPLTVDIDPGLDARLPDERALCVYRVVQECLNNIARHARQSTAVHIAIRQENQTLLVGVTNHAPPAGSAYPGSGMGLRLLAERLRAAGGMLSIDAPPGCFAVQASLPLLDRTCR